ncbi:MAG: hypothetical protein NTX50_18855 [Candidatus Sumerlaeota bacterium]|nr:hypothetical protein [Candidatus Sumerlaeota bacterium]
MIAYYPVVAHAWNAALRHERANPKEQSQSFPMNGSSANLMALNALMAAIRVLVAVAVSSAFAP